MATTTNYGWTTPDDTALVKDGASAIRALGTAIDTSMNTALGTKKSGLVLLNTTSFSGVTSGSVNSVFTSTYQNYEIICTLVGTTVEAFSMRLRASGSDNSTSNYYFTGFDTQSSSTTVNVRNGDPSTSWRIGTIGNDFTVVKVTVCGPQTTDKTSFVSASGAGNGTNEGYQMTLGGFFSGTTSFDGFSILGSSNFTGTARTYGWNN